MILLHQLLKLLGLRAYVPKSSHFTLSSFLRLFNFRQWESGAPAKG